MLVRVSLTLFLFASLFLNLATCRGTGRASGRSFGRAVRYCESCAVQPDGFVLAANHFGLNLYREISGENARQSDKENLFLSPFSVATAMAMVNQGAEGETAKQLESTLGFELARINGDKSTTGSEIKEANSLIFNPVNESYVLRSANALVVDQNSAIKESYKSGIQTYFEGEVITGNFRTNGKEMMDRINQWCSAKTNGKIESIISNPPTPPMALLNAVYFKGSWANKFNASFTKPAPFYQGGNTYQGVKYMFDGDHKYRFAFLEELNVSLVELPYDGENVSLYAFLPKDRDDDLSHLRHALNPWYIESAIKQMHSRDVKLTFPRFKFSSKYNLMPTLQQMGIKDAFGRKANFGGITPDLISVSEVKHMAVIEVNEEGSEAAAATYIGVAFSLPPPPEVFVFDHPFIFFLRHKSTGQLLFIGEINKLTAEMTN